MPTVRSVIFLRGTLARPSTVEDEELLNRLACVFSDVGYEGASLALLSEASGLQKASLYHRFAGGKRQMAEEVLASATSWLAANVLAPLNAEGPPAVRLRQAAAALDTIYQGGSKACLLNMLGSPRIEGGPFAAVIKRCFENLIDGLAKLARDAGAAPKSARERAARAVMLLQGSLVLSRGLGDTAPFRTFLKSLPQELL
jgi:TetR/AcrR family transcriptional regulator, lmrAB and yxaGH operons repressor